MANVVSLPDSNILTATSVDKSDSGNPNQTFTTTTEYDNLDRVTATIDNIGNRNESAYDSRGNAVRITDALDNVSTHVFDGLSRVVSTARVLTDTGNDGGAPIGEIVTTQTWDDSSRLLSQADDSGNATTYLYDPLNRRTTTAFGDGTTNTGLTLRENDYALDDVGNRTSVTGAGDCAIRKEVMSAFSSCGTPSRRGSGDRSRCVERRRRDQSEKGGTQMRPGGRAGEGREGQKARRHDPRHNAPAAPEDAPCADVASRASGTKGTKGTKGFSGMFMFFRLRKTHPQS